MPNTVEEVRQGVVHTRRASLSESDSEEEAADTLEAPSCRAAFEWLFEGLPGEYELQPRH